MLVMNIPTKCLSDARALITLVLTITVVAQFAETVRLTREIQETNTRVVSLRVPDAAGEFHCKSAGKKFVLCIKL